METQVREYSRDWRGSEGSSYLSGSIDDTSAALDRAHPPACSARGVLEAAALGQGV